MKKIVFILSVAIVLSLVLSSIPASAAGVSVSVIPGAYPNQTTFNWSDNCYTIYGLFPKQFNIILDGTLVTSVSKNVNTYSMVVTPGKHTVTIEAPLSGTKTVSESATFSVSKSTYNVMFNGNGGNGTPKNQIKTHGENLTLSDVTPKRQRYLFAGWSTNPNSTSVEYYPGDIYSADASITLYAVWNKVVGDENSTDENLFEFENGLITGFLSDISDVQIPHYIGEVPVTAIDVASFIQNKNIETVIIPDSVTTIGESAFYNCTNLKQISLPNSIVSIERNAFNKCTSLVEINLTNENLVCGDGVFTDCTSLKTIRLPQKMNSLSQYMFEGCIALENITLPSGLTEIPTDCFSGCSSLTSIDIPDTVTKVKNGAFRYCTSLSSVELSNNLQELGAYALSDTAITEISLPQNITDIGSGAFMGCTALQSIAIPNKVITIPTGFASGCTNLCQVDIPYGVTEIKGKAFENCVNLTEVVIPDSVTVVRGFNGCSNLSKVTLSKNAENIQSQCFKDCSSLKNIEFPQSVKFIGESAFEGCSLLEKIFLPTQLEEIDSLAFKDCTNLTSITIPDSVNRMGKQVFNNSGYYNNSSNWDGDVLYNGKWLLEAKTSISGNYAVKDSTRYICSFAFNDCESLTGITFPYGIEHIPDNLFVDCTSLVNVEFPDTVTSMEQAVFYNCSSLKNISLPDGIKSMGDMGWTFYMCSSLESVKLPYSISKIPDRTFYNCTNLKNITISELVTTIENSAFYNTNSLTDIYYSGTDWSNITIGTQNTALDNANIHYNYSYTVLPPVANIPSGEIESGTTIELNCLIDGATIYYTLDGTEPNNSSLPYNGGITITGDTVIKAIAIKEGLKNSDVVTFAYAVKSSLPVLMDYAVTHKKTSSYYKVYLTFDKPVDNANLQLVLYDSSGNKLSAVCEPCEGDDYYIVTIPVEQGSAEIRTFVWSKSIVPLALSKIIELK